MPESMIQFCAQNAKVNCDGNCEKAWGINSRPRDLEGVDLPDKELGTAPINPGTTEGGGRKPVSLKWFPNKWCVRECERCNMSSPGEHKTPLATIKYE